MAPCWTSASSTTRRPRRCSSSKRSSRGEWRSRSTTRPAVRSIQNFGPPLVSSFALLVVFGALYLAYRERFLAIWTAAWGVWALRYVYGHLGGGVGVVPDAVALPLLVVARAILMLWGAYELDRRPLPMGWRVVAVVDVIWIGVHAVLELDPAVLGARGVEHYVLFATALCWSGVLVLRSGIASGPEKAVAGVALLLFGLLQLAYPWSSALGPGLVESLFLIAHALQITIGLGVLLAFTRRSRAEAERLARELERSLTRALAGLLPICSYCKSIRDDRGAWSKLETYVSRRTDASFTHGICPDCERQHFPDESGAA